MTVVPRLSVIIASESCHANLPAILESLRAEATPDTEVLLMTREGAEPYSLPRDLPSGTRLIVAARESLIPHLWRDGILAARGSHVALLTSHCVPQSGWLTRASAAANAGRYVAIGGFFSNPLEADAASWAIYLLRYVGYSVPRHREGVEHVAADNAIYERDAILRCGDLLAHGFWEPAFHDRFRALGLELELDPGLRVEHRNRYSPSEFGAQRRAHGFEFGLRRAAALSRPSRLLYAIALPAVPIVLYAKVVVRAARAGWWLRAPAATWARLAQFVLQWSLGEARGVLHTSARGAP